MLLNFNLQFFAKDGPGGEKTEDATSKKLSDARKEGQVAKSKEIANGLGLISLFLVLKMWIGMIGNGLLEVFPMVYDRFDEYITYIDGAIPMNGIYILIRNVMLRILIILLPMFLVGFIVAFLADLIQVKWKPTSKPLKPKFSKLNPLKGFKKIFSAQSLVELVKAILKIGLILWVVYSTLKDKWGVLFLLYDMSLNQALVVIFEVTVTLGLKISCIYMIVAFADLLYQKWKFKNDMKMTKQEIKEEFKNQEGDPQIKGRIRQKMREISQKRMMQAIPKADVVITNPTHYAVAIQYNPEVSDAPIVVAKGQDFLAQKIKEIAKESQIEIIENKPLARMLYANVEIGAAVPPELYQAVAEVLAMVYQMQGKF